MDAGGALRPAACSNTAGCGGGQPALAVALRKGVGYVLVVDGVAGGAGKYSLR